jgi:hypothetical protein
LQTKPCTAVNFLFRSINRFSTPDASDYQVWDWVMNMVKADTVTEVLQKAHYERLKLSNVGQGTFLMCCTCPHLTWTSDIAIHEPNVAPPDLESSKDTRFLNVLGGFSPRFHSMTPTFVKLFR